MLVVDDEQRICTALDRLFGDDFQVTTLSCGEEAQQLLAGDADFDVVLCDLMMQPGSGMELFQWICAHQPQLEPRVLFITGGGVTPASRRFLAQQDHRTIRKPFNVPELVQRAHQLVHRSASGGT